MKYSFKKTIRENTGKSFLDSGDIYGRHYERPLPKKPLLVEVDKKRKEISVTISLLHFLEANFEIEQELTSWLRAQIELEKIENNYMAYADALAEKLGIVIGGSDNTYNHENDLDQNFQFSYFKDSQFLIIETHNGCDARGGYSSPLVVRETRDYGFSEVCCGFWGDNGVDQFEIGYASNPTYNLNKEIEKIISLNKKTNEIKVKLKNEAKTVILMPYFNNF
jgi:hypothetical protein